jgi:protein-tyrosine phosphatase
VTYRIALVCLGNICRSPIAHVVLDDRLVRAGLDERVEVSSSGTGAWHVGEPMDRRAAAVLRDAGYDPSRHRARTFSPDWFGDHDLVLAMDRSNLADMLDQAPASGLREGHLRMFREFDPEARDEDDEVPDPWYGGVDGFRDVLAMIERTTDGLVDRLPGLLGDGPHVRS